MCEPKAQPCDLREGETKRRPHWRPFPQMVEEDHGSPFGFRTRRVPDSPELLELTEIAIALGDPRAV